MKNSLLFICIFSIAFACTKTSGRYSQEKEKEDKDVVYICPMDCEDGKTYKKKKDCPVCGMAMDEDEDDD